VLARGIDGRLGKPIDQQDRSVTLTGQLRLQV
jgi:hypothetical protein